MAGSRSSTTATTPTRCRCAPPSAISPPPPSAITRPAASPCSGDMLELGPEARRYHEQLGELADEAGVDVLVTVGPLAAAIAERFDGEARSLADAGQAARPVPRLLARATWCWSRPRWASGSSSSAARWAMRATRDHRLRLRADPDRRHGVAADVPVPEPQVHRLPAPPGVRPEHPRGGPPGPPDQGGDADHGRDHHLHRDRDPVPAAVQARLAVAGGVRGRHRLRPAGLRRRLHEDRQAPLAGAARADQAGGHGRDLAGAVVDGHPEGRDPAHRPAPLRRSDRSTSARSTRCSSTWWSPGRPRRSTSPTASTGWPPAARRSCCSPTSGSRSSPPASTT